MKSFTSHASQKTKPTPAGEIPVDWTSSRIDDVCVIKGGVGFPLPHQGKIAGDYPFIKVSDFSLPGNGRGIRAANNWITEEVRKHLGATLLPEGSVVFAKVGAALLLNRRRFLTRPTCLDNNLMGLVPKKIDDRFLFQLFLTVDLGRYAQDGALPSINGGDVGNIPIALPPTFEQGKIADILHSWDEVLDKLDALIEMKVRRKTALMQRLLSGELRFPRFGRTSWRKVRMNTVLTRVFRPIEWAADKPLSLVSVRRRCRGLFRRPDVLGSEYKTQDLHELKTDDFLVSKRQVVHGAWALVTPEFEGTLVSKEYAILINASPDTLHMPFFSWLAQTPRLIRLARVACTGVHLEKMIFDPEVFLRDIVRVPSNIDEQKQVAKTLDGCAAEIRLLEKQRTAIKRQKSGLMQQLLTGKLRVKAS